MTDEPNPITFDAKAWQEGFAVGRRGGERTDNPYPPGDSALAWINGSRVKRSRCSRWRTEPWTTNALRGPRFSSLFNWAS
jgi:hypothetical protein